MANVFLNLFCILSHRIYIVPSAPEFAVPILVSQFQILLVDHQAALPWYLGANTIWYLQFHFVCAKLFRSFIWMTSLCFFCAVGGPHSYSKQREFFCLHYRHKASFEPLAQRVVFGIQTGSRLDAVSSLDPLYLLLNDSFSERGSHTVSCPRWPRRNAPRRSGCRPYRGRTAPSPTLDARSPWP